MRVHHHPRNLRRSFGSQTVVCVGRPSWSEAGIAAQVIPAQSSRWTSRGQGDVHCRLADLPTCRLWSWMTDGVPGRALCSRYSSGASFSFNTNVEGFAQIRPSRLRQPSQGSAIVRKSSPVLPRGTTFLSPFPLEIAANIFRGVIVQCDCQSLMNYLFSKHN